MMCTLKINISAKETILRMDGVTPPREYYLADQIDRINHRLDLIESRLDMVKNMEGERGERNIHPALKKMTEEAMRYHKTY